MNIRMRFLNPKHFNKTLCLLVSLLILPACYSPETKTESTRIKIKQNPIVQAPLRKVEHKIAPEKRGIAAIKKQETMEVYRQKTHFKVADKKQEKTPEKLQLISSCDSGFLMHEGECVKKEMSCLLKNGEGKKHWKHGQYGHCKVSHCDLGFRRHKGQCVAICQEDEVFFDSSCRPIFEQCSVKGKEGIKIWDMDGYGSCQI